MSLSAKQIRELGICWNSVIRKLFNYNKWESVNGVLHGLGRLNISHLIMLRKLNFISICFYRLIVCCIMCLTLLWYTTTLVMLRTVFMPQCLAVNLVYQLFEDYVG